MKKFNERKFAEVNKDTPAVFGYSYLRYFFTDEKETPFTNTVGEHDITVYRVNEYHKVKDLIFKYIHDTYDGFDTVYNGGDYCMDMLWQDNIHEVWNNMQEQIDEEENPARIEELKEVQVILNHLNVEMTLNGIEFIFID